MDIAFLIGRILFGGFFIINGLNHLLKMESMVGYAASKHVPAPKVAIFITGIMLLLGGFGVLLGAFVMISVVILVVFLTVTAFIMHDFWDVRDEPMRTMEKVNFMKNIALAGSALTLLSIPEPWYANLTW